MPKGYHHLAYEQRCQIYALLKRGFSQSEIAQDLGVHQSTISREVRRSRGKKGYRHKQAQEKSLIRRYKASSKPRKMVPELIFFLEQKIREKQWSPEQISGRMHAQFGVSISCERIYLHIWKDKRAGGSLYKNLRCGGKKYNRRRNKSAGRGLISGRIGIEKRPVIVDAKVRVGDFEIDTIVGAQHRGAIVSLVDRRTKLTKLYLLPQATSEATAQAIIHMLKPVKEHVYTLTADNGKEFSKHATIAQQLHAEIYFANPYHAWERGLNENTNGLMRQYFPKNCDFTTLTQEQLQNVEFLLNTRPRKSLGFQTPAEIFLHLTGHQLRYALQS